MLKELYRLKKDQPMTQAAGAEVRGTCLYEADQSATMAGAIMKRMLLAGSIPCCG